MKLVLLLLLYSMACAVPQPNSKIDLSKVQNIGQIKLVDSNNKTYAIYTKDGKSYLPLNLEEKFKKEGLKVVFEGTIDTSRLKNIRVAGFPISIDKIRVQ